MVDPQAVDESVPHEREDELVRPLKDERVLLADPREVVDVEEAPVAAGDRIDVEEPRARLRVSPVAVVLVDGHVIWDDVEDQSHAGVARRPGEPLELLGATERVRQATRVDHVVAVGRAGARLQRRRQVEMRDAEVAEVGDEQRAPANPKPAVSWSR